MQKGHRAGVRGISSVVISIAAMAVGCGEDEAALQCGPGTHDVDGACVPSDVLICGSGTFLEGNVCLPEAPQSYPVKSSDWVAAVDWSTATTVNLAMVEGVSTYEFSPSSLSFEVGKPYILHIENPPPNANKHYFFAPEFMRAIAIRKAQTPDAEYKAPTFYAFELLIPGAAATQVDLYFVPVLRGGYTFHCTIGDHAERGMHGEIIITPNPNFPSPALDQGIDYDNWIGPDPRSASSHGVWSATNVDYFTGGTPGPIRTVEVDYTNNVFRFEPSTVQLTAGTGYRIRIENPAGNQSKHYFTAGDFYKTLVWRKAQDSHAEVKVPYLTAMELLRHDTITHFTEFFVVPTVAGDYGSVCTVLGHAAGGMIGTVKVAP